MEDKLIPNKNFDAPIIMRLVKIGTGKILAMAVVVCIFLGMWFLYNELYIAEAQNVNEVNFTVEKGEIIDHLVKRLGEENIIKNQWLFKKYLVW